MRRQSQGNRSRKFIDRDAICWAAKEKKKNYEKKWGRREKDERRETKRSNVFSVYFSVFSLVKAAINSQVGTRHDRHDYQSD